MKKPKNKTAKKKTNEAVLKELKKPSTTVDVAAQAYGMSRAKAYRAIKDREIESFRIGGSIIVPTAPIRKRLGLEAT